MSGHVPPSSLRAAAFTLLAASFALNAVAFGIAVGGTSDQARVHEGLQRVWNSDAEFKGGSSGAYFAPWMTARQAFDAFSTALLPLGLLALAWAALASWGEGAGKRLLTALGAGVAAFVVFGPLERPLMGLLGLGNGNLVAFDVLGSLALGAVIALVVSVTGARAPTAAAVAGAVAGAGNTVAYAILPRIWDATGSYFVTHALPLALAWLSGALYAGALASAAFAQVRATREMPSHALDPISG